jgi:hypothetical protein
MSELVWKLLSIHDSLTTAGLRHAFGGAISLAYCTAEPRGTRDLDVNVFIPAERADEVAAALPADVKIDDADIRKIMRDGQTRVMWGNTPVDLFLNNLPVHEEIAEEVRWVPLAGREIPVLSCESLVYFKTFFNRTKDWADIEAIAEVDRSILTRAAARVESLVGEDTEYAQRLRRIATGGEAIDR